MGVNVVNYGGKTIVDMTDATATAETVLAGYTAYGADGDIIVGTLTPTVHNTVSVTLSCNRWVDNVQTVCVDFATADAMVVAGGAPGDQEYLDCEVWCSGQDDGLLTFSCTYTPAEDVIANIGLLTTGNLIITYATGSTISLNDSAQRKLRGLTIYGKTTQNGTPSPTAPVPLVSAGDSGSITVSVDEQNLVVSTPNGLPGIRVDTGGNNVDTSGQQWVCDVVDLGTGEYVQNVLTTVFDGSDDEGWVSNATNTTGVYRMASSLFADKIVSPPDTSTLPTCLCSHYQKQAAGGKGTYGKNVGISINVGAVIIFDERFNTPSSFKEFLASNPVSCVFKLATPIRTPLSAEELAAYSSLHTNSPNTTITTNTGAEMLVRYVKE